MTAATAATAASSALRFDAPLALAAGLPALVALLVLLGLALRRRGLSRPRAAALVALRGGALAALVLLAARPVRVSNAPLPARGRPVMLLVDRSESMSLEASPLTRFGSATAFARRELLPALKEARLETQVHLFAGEAEASSEEGLARATPDGRQTNLARAVAHAIAAAPAPPLAIVALTDGAANETAENARALSALAEANAPFLAVGFGTDRGVATLSLRALEAPPVAAPRSPFEISAQLTSANVDEPVELDLLLLRDGGLHETRRVTLATGSRTFRETFRLSEAEEGVRSYEARLVPPAAGGVRLASSSARASVRISLEKELRILYVQGALTWDYKFITLALRGDPAMKITGLTRTSSQSLFRQNVESAGELVHGFPTTLQEMAPFRVIVLESLGPRELTPEQQELLSRFCGELGGGLLMMGGAATFESSWKGTRLEQLLPVVFASGGVPSDRPFRLHLTDEALRHPVFQIADGPSPAAAWRKLPTFTHFGRVDSAKPGAEVWARHDSEPGTDGRRILMAVQRYGAGLSAVVSMESFWRWRLARDSEPAQFDRFWRQLFRHLAEASRQDVAIHVTDPELRPGHDVHLVLERQPNPKNLGQTAAPYRWRVEDGKKTVLGEESVELAPSRPVEASFRAERPDLYVVSVLDGLGHRVATRTIEVREVDRELLSTGRNMELLRQWAALSDGLAVKAEECAGGRDLVEKLKEKADPARRRRMTRRPLGVNGWVLGALVLGLSAEWALRKRWGLS